MWSCISGRPPPPATDRAIKDNYKPAARTYARRYSNQLLEAIDWCLQMNQLERPQNVQALLDFLSAEPVEPPEPEGGDAIWGIKLPWRKKG
jgi:hypothetical protein